MSLNSESVNKRFAEVRINKQLCIESQIQEAEVARKSKLGNRRVSEVRISKQGDF